MKPKILILGYGRGGKDTMAEYLRDKYGYQFTSSSEYAAKKFICESLRHLMGYESFSECYEDRHNWRSLWYELICAYNKDNPARLASEMISDGYDIYVGMRSKIELQACLDASVFDCTVWVDGADRTGYIEPESSCTVTPDMADVVIDNNGTLEEFHRTIDGLFSGGQQYVKYKPL